MNFLNVAFREIKILQKNKFVLFCMLVMPFMFCLCLAVTFSSGSVYDLPVAVVDHDRSAFSRQIIRSLDATSSIQVKYHLDDEKSAHDMLSSRKIYALLIIPKNFNHDLKALKRPSLSYYYNNQTMLIGGLLSKDLKTVLEGVKIKAYASVKSKSGITLKEASNTVNLISQSEHIHSNPYLNYSYFLVYIGIAHTFQVFCLLIGAWTFGFEFKYGSGPELFKTAEDSVLNAIAGKSVVYIGGLSLEIFLTVSLYILFGGAPFSGSMLFFMLNTPLFVAACLSFAFILTVIFANFRMVMSIVACSASLGFTMTGGTFPSVAMPDAIRYLAAVFPVSSYASLLTGEAMQGHPSVCYLDSTIYLCLTILAGSLFYKLFYKRVQEPKLWHKL